MIFATWNLENLFRPGADAGPTDEQAYDAKLTERARVIGEVAPDVLAVQEVGDPDALEDLRGRLDGEWFAQSSELPDGRGIRVGFLSRLPLDEVEQVREFPDGLAPVQVDDDGTHNRRRGAGLRHARIRSQAKEHAQCARLPARCVRARDRARLDERESRP